MTRWLPLLVHAILVQTTSYALRPALTYAIIGLDLGPVWPAVLSAAFAVPPLLLALTTGRLVDRVGERPGMIIGAVALIASSLLAWAGATSPAVLVAATALLGVGVVFSMVGEQSAVAGQARGKVDSAFGGYTLFTSVGQGLGPLLLLLPPLPGSAIPPTRTIALACAGAGLVVLATSFGFGTRQRSPSAGTPARELLALPGVWRALLVSGLILASVDVAFAYLPVLAHERGLSPSWLTTMLVARAAAQMLSRAGLGRLSRTVGRRRLTVISCAVSAVALCGLTLDAAVGVLVGLAAVYGFAAGVGQPMTMGWVTQLAPTGTRGTMLSLRLAGNRVAQTVLPMVSGATAAATGYSGVLLATGVTLGAAAWSAAAIPPDQTPP